MGWFFVVGLVVGLVVLVWVVCVMFDLGFGVFVLGGWEALLFVICFVFVGLFVCLLSGWVCWCLVGMLLIS